MAKKNIALNTTVSLTNQTAAGSRGVVNSFNNMSQAAQNMQHAMQGSFKALAGGFTAMVVAKKGSQILQGAIGPAVAYESAVNKLSIASHKTGKDLKMMAEEAAVAAAKTGFTPTEAIEGMQELSLTFSNTRETLQSILPVLTLAQTYFGNNVPVAIQHSTTLAKSFGLTGDQVAQTLDKWVAVAKTAGISVDSMAVGFKKLGAAAAMSNSSFEEMAPLLAIASKAGVPAREAATGLFTAFSNLARPTAQKGLEENLGIIVSEGGRMREPQAILIDLAKQMEKMGSSSDVFKDSLRKAIGQRALFPMIQILTRLNEGIHVQGKGMRFGTDLLKDFSDEMTNSTGLLKQMGEQGMDPLIARVGELSDTFSLLLVKVFMPLVDTIKPVVRSLTEMVEGLTKSYESSSATGYMLRMLGSIIRNVGVAALAAVAAMLAWQGGTLVLTGALAATGIGIKSNTNATNQNTAAAIANTQANNAQARSMLAVGAAANTANTGVKVLSTGIKSAMRVAGIMITVGLLLWDAYDAIFGKAPKDTADAGDKATKNKQRLATATQMASASLMRAEDAGKSIANGAEILDKGVTKWKDMVKAKLPMPSMKAMDLLRERAGALLKTKGVQEKFGMPEWIKEQLSYIKKAETERQLALESGKMPSQATMQKAAEALKNLSPYMESFYPHQRKFNEAIAATGKEYERAAKATGDVAKILVEGAGYMAGTIAMEQNAAAQKSIEVNTIALDKTIKLNTARMDETNKLRDVVKGHEAMKDALMKEKKALEDLDWIGRTLFTGKTAEDVKREIAILEQKIADLGLYIGGTSAQIAAGEKVIASYRRKIDTLRGSMTDAKDTIKKSAATLEDLEKRGRLGSAVGAQGDVYKEKRKQGYSITEAARIAVNTPYTPATKVRPVTATAPTTAAGVAPAGQAPTTAGLVDALNRNTKEVAKSNTLKRGKTTTNIRIYTTEGEEVFTATTRGERQQPAQ